MWSAPEVPLGGARWLAGAGLVLATLSWAWGTTPAAAQPIPTSPPTTTGPTTTVGSAGPQPPSTARPPSMPSLPGPGLFDFGGRVRAAMNGLVRELAARAIGPAVELAARSVLATPNLTAAEGRVAELWQLSAGLANGAYVLLVCAGGVLLLANESLQTRYAVKDVAPRLVVGMVAANTSLWAISVGIEATNALSRALLGPDITPAQAEAALRAVLIFPLDQADLLLLLAVLVVAGLALVLVASYVVRVAVLVVLTAAGPLALACHGLPQTEAVARWWWRATTACLAVPVAQSLALSCALRVLFPTDADQLLGLGGARLVDLLVAGCLLWLLARIPAWALRLVFVGRPTTLVTVARSYVVYRLVRRGLAHPSP
jgi:hypothetical protein